MAALLGRQAGYGRRFGVDMGADHGWCCQSRGLRQGTLQSGKVSITSTAELLDPSAKVGHTRGLLSVGGVSAGSTGLSGDGAVFKAEFGGNRVVLGFFIL